MRVLVATSRDADDRKTLAAVRSLGRKGHRVHVAADHAWSPAAWSRFARGTIRTPTPLAAPSSYRRALSRAIDALRPDVFLPLSDDVTRVWLDGPDDERAPVPSPLPPLASLVCAHDKWDLGRLAVELGVPVPETHAPADRGELSILCRQITYPVVLKLRRGAAAAGLAFPASPEELLEAYDRRPTRRDAVVDGAAVLVQTYVHGDVHDACLLADHGRIVAALTQRRVRMHPVGGGVGVVCETTWEPRILAHAALLVRALDWHGPAQLEFLRDHRHGGSHLLEMNARFWGTLDLAIRAGVDFPSLACRLARGEDVEGPPAYRVGLRYRWLWPYVPRQLADPRARRGLARAFFAPRPGVRSDLWPTDAIPHVVDACRALTARAIARRRPFRDSLARGRASR